MCQCPFRVARICSWTAGPSCYVPDNLAVDGAGHAVLELQVHLGDGVFGEDRGIGDITCGRDQC